jgi:hypothetical protein
MWRRMHKAGVGGALASPLICLGLWAAPALGLTGSSDDVAGTWTGTSFDTTFSIPGELTATFTVRSPSTFSGSVHAVFPPELNPPETCSASSGQVSSTGVVQIESVCRTDDGSFPPEGAVILGQLDSSGQTMTGTFHGAFRDQGTFTLHKSEG